MNINKLLCKYLDNEKLGYVTIGRIMEVICNLLAFSFVFYLFGLAIHIFSNPSMTTEKFDIIILIYYAVGIIFIVACGYLFLILLIHLSNIKIAKCPLKEDGEKENKE